MAYKIKQPKLKDRGLSKSGDMRSLYLVESEGMQFWTLIPPQREEGEKLIKNKVFKISKLKEGWIGKYPISKADIEAIKEEKKQGF